MFQNEPIASERTFEVFLVDNYGNGVSGVSRAAGASLEYTPFGGSLTATANDLAAVDGQPGAYTLQMNQAEVATAGSFFATISTNTFATPFRVFVINDKIKPVTDCVRYFLAAGGAAGYVVLDSGASATDNYYAGNGQDVVAVIVSGTGAGQSRLGTGYTGSTKRLAVTPNWGTAPDTTSVVKLFAYVGQLDATTISAIQSGLATTSSVSALATASALSTVATNVLAIPTTPLLTSDSRLNGLSNLDATVSSRATPGAAMALTSGERSTTAAVIATAILTSSLGAGHTVQGALRRADWINIGKLTGGLSVLATFYQYDGSTVGVQATQDPVLGTRAAASTAAGD